MSVFNRRDKGDPEPPPIVLRPRPRVVVEIDSEGRERWEIIGGGFLASHFWGTREDIDHIECEIARLKIVADEMQRARGVSS